MSVTKNPLLGTPTNFTGCSFQSTQTTGINDLTGATGLPPELPVTAHKQEKSTEGGALEVFMKAASNVLELTWFFSSSAPPAAPKEQLEKPKVSVNVSDQVDLDKDETRDMKR